MPKTFFAESKRKLEIEKEEFLIDYARTYLNIVTSGEPPTKDELEELDDRVNRLNGVETKLDMIRQVERDKT